MEESTMVPYCITYQFLKPAKKLCGLPVSNFLSTEQLLNSLLLGCCCASNKFLVYLQGCQDKVMNFSWDADATT